MEEQLNGNPVELLRVLFGVAPGVHDSNSRVHHMRSLLDSHECETPTASASCGPPTIALLKSPLAQGDTGSTIGAEDAQGQTDDYAEMCSAVAMKVDSPRRPTPPLPIHIFPSDTHPTAPLPAIPTWLTGLVNANLFQPCAVHCNERKNECTFFCTACTPASLKGLCRHCHLNHKCPCPPAAPLPAWFQTRRYMYQNVVLVDDLAPHYNLTGIQAYMINGKRAVLLQPKPPAANAAVAGPAFNHFCAGCSVSLNTDFTFCSLKCKVEGQCEEHPTPAAADRPPSRPSLHPSGEPSPLSLATPVAPASKRVRVIGIKRARAAPTPRPPSATTSDQTELRLPSSDEPSPPSATAAMASARCRRKHSHPARSFLD